jgi:hypothetical protein
MPKPNTTESKKEWMDRCLSSPEQNKSFPDTKQRYAVCLSLWENKDKKKQETTVVIARK